LHFAVRVTSPIEGCHATLKAYLKVSTSDLKGVFDRLLPYWQQQHKSIAYALAYEKNQVKHRLNKRYFDKVQALVCDRALLIILGECAKLHKLVDEKKELQWPCECTIPSSMGLPCLHTVSERLKDGGHILPEDIHLFWWYKRSKWEESLLQECGESRTILEPLVVRGKGRPKGSKGKQKGDGVSSMIPL
jgi:hypothetical protein